MRWDELTEAVGPEPLFESGMLLVGPVDAEDMQRQLSRWVAAGRLIRVRRGLYAFAGRDAEVRRPLHPYEIANRLVSGSYVSLNSVLSEGGLIPEYVPVTTSITTGRAGLRANPLGNYLYRHVKRSMFWGYESRDLPTGGRAFVAVPEKALVDLLYLHPEPDHPGYVEELRLQNLDRIRLDVLSTMAARCARVRVVRAVDRIIEAAEVEKAS
jgi:predicted transcriptional regulator of viral defense system